MDEISLGVGIAIGCVLVFSILFCLSASKFGEFGDGEELGQSICEENYDMNFESYYDKVLTCKPKLESYDGIKIDINGGFDDD